MNLWEKIVNAFEEGIEITSEKGSKYSNLMKLKWEQRSIHKQMQEELLKFGKKTFSLHETKNEEQLVLVTEENTVRLEDLEKKLKKIEKQIEELSFSIDKKQIRGLKKDLEMGDGVIEQIVIEQGSSLLNKKLMDLKFPKNVLIGTIVRNNKVTIPDGKTVLKEGDKVTILGKKEDVQVILKKLGK